VALTDRALKQCLVKQTGKDFDKMTYGLCLYLAVQALREELDQHHGKKKTGDWTA
jgi:hypothetical protein